MNPVADAAITVLLMQVIEITQCVESAHVGSMPPDHFTSAPNDGTMLDGSPRLTMLIRPTANDEVSKVVESVRITSWKGIVRSRPCVLVTDAVDTAGCKLV